MVLVEWNNLTFLYPQYLLEGDLDTWEAPKEIAEKYPYYLSGYDEENRPSKLSLS